MEFIILVLIVTVPAYYLKVAAKREEGTDGFVEKPDPKAMYDRMVEARRRKR